MDWMETTVSTTTQAADAVSELMVRCGALGTQIIDRADIPDPSKPHGYWELIDQAMIDAMPEDVRVKAWFARDGQLSERLAMLRALLEQLPERAGFPCGALTVDTQGVRESDWAEYWKQYYKPFRAGKTLVVKPSWEDYAPQAGDRVIELDPGMAFGTGTHETTALCIQLIEQYYAGGRVMDIGTGSGILAIAAALLGAKDVLAIDIDGVAVRVARENVAKNGLSARVRVQKGDLLAGVEGMCELAVANILADVIAMLCGPLREHITPGGLFICSGIIREREQDVRAALTAAGYALLDRREQGEWVALVARR